MIQRAAVPKGGTLPKGRKGAEVPKGSSRFDELGTIGEGSYGVVVRPPNPPLHTQAVPRDRVWRRLYVLSRVPNLKKEMRQSADS